MNSQRSFVLAAAFVTLVVSGCSQPRNITDHGLEPQFGTPAADGAAGLARYSGGVYVVGSTSGNLHSTHKGGGDAFIRKVNASGTLMWGRQFGTAAAYRATDVATDTSGNTYVLGQTGGTLARALRGPSDFFLRKYSPSGTVLWTNQMGLDTADLPGGVAVSGGFIYVVGVSQDLGTFVYRFNAKGGTSWKRQVAPALQHELTSDVAVDGGGNVYVAASVPAPCEEPNFFDNCSNVKVDKYSASGTLAWSRQVSLAQRNSLHAVAAYGRNIYLIDESFDVPDDDSYTQLVKLDAAGTVQWTRSIGLADVYSPNTYISTDLSADGRGIYTASTQFSYWESPYPQRITYSVARLDLAGSLVWRAGELFDYGDFEGPVGAYIDGSLGDILVRGGELYVAGSRDGGAGRGSEALLQRLSAATGATVWKR